MATRGTHRLPNGVRVRERELERARKRENGPMAIRGTRLLPNGACVCERERMCVCVCGCVCV